MDPTVKATNLLDITTDFKTIKQSAVNSVLIQLLFRLRGIITLPILTYYLLPAELGTLNLILITSSMLTPVFTMNLTDGPAIHMVLEKSRERLQDMYNTVVNATVIFFCVYGAVFWLIVPPSPKVLDKGKLLVLLLVFSNVLYKDCSYIFAVFQKTSVLVKNTLLKDGLSTILAIALVVAGFSYGGVVMAMVTSGVFAGILLLKHSLPDLPYRVFISREVTTRFLKTSLPLLPVFFFSWIIQSSDSYFIAYFKGQQEVGKYSVVYSLAGVILTLTFALNFFWFPVSARLWADNREKYKKAFRLLFAGFAIVLFTATVAFELNSKIIMGLFARHREYQDAHIIIGIIAFAYCMQVLITLLTAPLYSAGRNVTILLSYLVGGILNITLNWLVIPKYGLLGAAINTATCYFLVVASMAYANYRVLGFDFIDRRLLSVAPVFMCAWGAAAYLRQFLNVYPVLVLDVVLILSIGCVLYCFVLKDYEMNYLKTLVRELVPGKGKR